MKKEDMLPLELQRIVDGEMPETQRTALLRSLGNDAPQWRSLALALLEEQQWSRGIRLDALEGIGSRIERLIDPAVASDAPPAPVASVPHLGGGGMMNWFTALAASGLLCLGIAGGMAFRSFQTAHEEKTFAKSRPGLSASERTAPPAEPELDNRAQFAWDRGGTSSSERIPLVDGNGMNPNLLLAKDAYEMARWQREMLRKGYRMEVQPRVYSGRLDDGRQILLPVHNVALKSVGL